MTQLSLDRTLGRIAQYDVVESGLNYRIDELRSSLAKVQIAKLKKSTLQREKYFFYKKKLANLPITVPFENINYTLKLPIIFFLYYCH